MRKVILLCLIFVGMAGMAQTRVASYVAFAGAGSDTINEGGTRSYTFDLANHNVLQAADISLFMDRTSGTVTNTVRIYWSNNGTNWPGTAADSVDITGASADEFWAKTYTPCKGRFLKINVLNTSAVQAYKLYGYLRVYKK